MAVVRTVDDVKDEFLYLGMTISQWAKKYGYPYHTVQYVLSGKSKYTHGQAHEIAVLLGLKKGFFNNYLEEGGLMKNKSQK